MIQVFVSVIIFCIMVGYITNSWGLALFFWALIGFLVIVFDGDLRRSN